MAGFLASAPSAYHSPVALLVLITRGINMVRDGILRLFVVAHVALGILVVGCSSRDAARIQTTGNQPTL